MSSRTSKTSVQNPFFPEIPISAPLTRTFCGAQFARQSLANANHQLYTATPMQAALQIDQQVGRIQERLAADDRGIVRVFFTFEPAETGEPVIHEF
jgi:hypothetical protein